MSNRISDKIKFILLLLLLFVLIFLSLGLGSVIIPFDQWINLFFDTDASTVYSSLIWDYRFPKMLSLVLTGVALGISGLLMQTLFRNPIVGPYILGLSSGAGLFVAIVVLGGGVLGWSLGQFSLSIAAATGSILTLLLIISFYYKMRNVISLLIVGLMLGIFSGALVQILSYFSRAEALQKYVLWSMGNPGNLSGNELFFFFLTVTVFSVLSVFLIKSLNALLLGEQYALALGFSLKRIHLEIILITGILTGIVTAFVGPIAFVGLMVPHIARKIFDTQLHQKLLPAVMLLGASLLLICDLIAQLPGSSLTLPLNGVTALLGAPLVIYMVYKRN